MGNHVHSPLSRVNFEHHLLYEDKGGANRLIVRIRTVLLGQHMINIKIIICYINHF